MHSGQLEMHCIDAAGLRVCIPKARNHSPNFKEVRMGFVKKALEAVILTIAIVYRSVAVRDSNSLSLGRTVFDGPCN